MTRVNVGISPTELCNEHLLAEYRELPRCFRRFKTRPPRAFKLGTGHMTWCAQYQGSLKLRQAALIRELEYRGYNIRYTLAHTIHSYDLHWSSDDEWYARAILLPRLIARMHKMANGRGFHYTNRARPDWYND
jgi:hypothetical protein